MYARLVASTTMVQAPAYRRFERSRIAANDATMALLIGSRLGSHGLSLSSNSRILLGDMYPDVEEVSRFNRTSEDAEVLVSRAERDLAYMAIPYALAIYGDFVAATIATLQDAGLTSDVSDPWRISLAKSHRRLCQLLGAEESDLPSEQLTLFDFLRRMRNRIVHADAVADPELVERWTNMPDAAHAEWLRIAQRTPTFNDFDGRLKLGSPELRVAVAATKTLSEAVNTLMARSAVQSAWADIALIHYCEDANSDPQSVGLQSLRGFARMYYRTVALSDGDLSAAINRAQNG